MGYTHYWYRPKEIKIEVFRKIVDDFKKLLPAFRMLSIQLANGVGEGEPIINYEEVIFNGKRDGHNCGHIVIPWPDDNIVPLFPSPDPEKAVSGSWFGGDLLKQRACDGDDCSYETFYFPRVERYGHVTGPIAYYNMNGEPVYNNKRVVGKVFNCCKTAFRPYDLAVISFLIIAKHYLGSQIIVHTDGKYQHWMDGFRLCQSILGYGEEFTIKNGELVVGDKPIVIIRGDRNDIR